jgi:hypothetical protein
VTAELANAVLSLDGQAATGCARDRGRGRSHLRGVESPKGMRIAGDRHMSLTFSCDLSEPRATHAVRGH